MKRALLLFLAICAVSLWANPPYIAIYGVSPNTSVVNADSLTGAQIADSINAALSGDRDASFGNLSADAITAGNGGISTSGTGQIIKYCGMTPCFSTNDSGANIQGTLTVNGIPVGGSGSPDDSAYARIVAGDSANASISSGRDATFNNLSANLYQSNSQQGIFGSGIILNPIASGFGYDEGLRVNRIGDNAAGLFLGCTDGSEAGACTWNIYTGFSGLNHALEFVRSNNDIIAEMDTTGEVKFNYGVDVGGLLSANDGLTTTGISAHTGDFDTYLKVNGVGVFTADSVAAAFTEHGFVSNTELDLTTLSATNLSGSFLSVNDSADFGSSFGGPSIHIDQSGMKHRFLPTGSLIGVGNDGYDTAIASASFDSVNASAGRFDSLISLTGKIDTLVLRVAFAESLSVAGSAAADRGIFKKLLVYPQCCSDINAIVFADSTGLYLNTVSSGQIVGSDGMTGALTGIQTTGNGAVVLSNDALISSPSITTSMGLSFLSAYTLPYVDGSQLVAGSTFSSHSNEYFRVASDGHSITYGTPSGTGVTSVTGSGGISSSGGSTPNLTLTHTVGTSDTVPYNRNPTLWQGGTWHGKLNVPDTLNAGVLQGSYVGSTGIVTVGTIGTGTWAGTTVSDTHGGTGLTGCSSGDQVLSRNTANGAWECRQVLAGSNISIGFGSGTITITNTGGGGGGGVSSGYVDSTMLRRHSNFNGLKYGYNPSFDTLGIDSTGRVKFNTLVSNSFSTGALTATTITPSDSLFGLFGARFSGFKAGASTFSGTVTGTAWTGSGTTTAGNFSTAGRYTASSSAAGGYTGFSVLHTGTGTGDVAIANVGINNTGSYLSLQYNTGNVIATNLVKPMQGIVYAGTSPGGLVLREDGGSGIRLQVNAANAGYIHHSTGNWSIGSDTTDNGHTLDVAGTENVTGAFTGASTGGFTGKFTESDTGVFVKGLRNVNSAGTGIRLATNGADGTFGNGTTIVGANTWTMQQTFTDSLVNPYYARFGGVRVGGLLSVGGKATFLDTTVAVKSRAAFGQFTDSSWTGNQIALGGSGQNDPNRAIIRQSSGQLVISAISTGGSPVINIQPANDLTDQGDVHINSSTFSVNGITSFYEAATFYDNINCDHFNTTGNSATGTGAAILGATGPFAGINVTPTWIPVAWQGTNGWVPWYH